MAASEQHTPVLVVGGSLVGLSSALFLAWHGVRCMVVERHVDLLLHPRLRVLYPRAMEAYRQVGLDEAIYAAASGTGAEGWRAVRAETLAGEHDPVDEDEAAGAADASPCAMPNIDQHKVETLLRARAEAAAAHGLTTDGALLVRPDGFVAWRSAERPVEPVAELEQVLRTVLSR